ncbi:hypothetical protein GCM10011514_17300 [Emticicia aquatilis]|uniref:DUF255 domain-containing protein n=1 Tax=Emticicia aquatilis TaxID=1537369 RepID=A0A917DPD3_9BACT|nr:thioredoxin family protein [Emticicia aquatilis]GGD53697.1 hypothetical protein GCM10011514_17300 [Emticicia aquatilis]
MLFRFFVVLLLLTSQIGFSQVKFENFDDLQALLTAAKTRNKLIFVQTKSDNCNQCNDVARTGLSSTKLREKYAQNFISVEIDSKSKIYGQLLEKTGLRGLPPSTFFDAEGALIYQFAMTTSAEMKYLEVADEAIANAKNPASKEFEMKYKNGNRDKAFLKKYIEYKLSVEQEADKLVDEYIDQHTIGDLSTIDNVKFLMSTAPALDSKARKIMYVLLPEKTVDSLFRALPLSERVKINNQIIDKTTRIAVRQKNVVLANRLSSFVAGTYDSDWEKANFFNQITMLNFFNAIKDTPNYLQRAEPFAEYTLMRYSPDSLLKKEEIARTRSLERSRAEVKKEGRVEIAYASFYNRYANELNNIAFNFLTYSNDLEKLAKALKWSKRALEINEELAMDKSRKKNPYMMDTYAQLLFKLGQKEEAIKWQTDVIETAKLWKADTTKFEETLEKMKK